MQLRKRIGFLGCGNMGRGILAGMIEHKIARPQDIFVHDVIGKKLLEVRKHFNVRTVSHIEDLVRQVDILLLAFKPQDLREAGVELRKHLTPRHLVITILAGVPIARIKKELGLKTQVVRAMPNLGATIGQAVTAITGSRKNSLGLAAKIFSGCGEVLRLPEKLFDAVTALSGSGPAYFFYLIELLVKQGIKHGLSKREAELLIKQTAKGAAFLAWQSKESPASLRQRVTSKGGTTEAALRTLDQRGFPRILGQAIANAIKQAQRLGRR